MPHHVLPPSVFFATSPSETSASHSFPRKRFRLDVCRATRNVFATLLEAIVTPRVPAVARVQHARVSGSPAMIFVDERNRHELPMSFVVGCWPMSVRHRQCER